MILIFDFDRTLLDTERFAKETNYTSNLSKEEESVLAKKAYKYLFPKTKETLDYLKNKGHRLFLITLGERSFQKAKIENSGIKNYFEKIIYEEKDKSKNKFLKELAKIKEDFLIINDKPEESSAIQKILGKRAKIFLIKSFYSKNYKGQIHRGIEELRVDF